MSESLNVIPDASGERYDAGQLAMIAKLYRQLFSDCDRSKSTAWRERYSLMDEARTQLDVFSEEYEGGMFHTASYKPHTISDPEAGRWRVTYVLREVSGEAPTLDRFMYDDTTAEELQAKILDLYQQGDNGFGLAPEDVAAKDGLLAELELLREGQDFTMIEEAERSRDYRASHYHAAQLIGFLEAAWVAESAKRSH
jgi:hypothetical protein